jgi:hypothetical protein
MGGNQRCKIAAKSGFFWKKLFLFSTAWGDCTGMYLFVTEVFLSNFIFTLKRTDEGNFRTSREKTVW